MYLYLSAVKCCRYYSCGALGWLHRHHDPLSPVTPIHIRHCTMYSAHIKVQKCYHMFIPPSIWYFSGWHLAIRPIRLIHRVLELHFCWWTFIAEWICAFVHLNCNTPIPYLNFRCYHISLKCIIYIHTLVLIVHNCQGSFIAECN